MDLEFGSRFHIAASRRITVMELLVIAGVAFLLGWAVISLLPRATAMLPATIAANKWGMIFATGVFVFLAFFVIAWAAKTATGRTVPA